MCNRTQILIANGLQAECLEKTYLLFLSERKMSEALDLVDCGREYGMELLLVELPPGALVSFPPCPGGYHTCVGYGG